MAYSDVVLSDNPVSYWRLGENSATNLPQDERGVNHATSQTGGEAATGLLTGDPNGARSFDGVGDGVQVPHSASLLMAAPFSLETWMRPTAITDAYLVTKGQNDYYLYAFADGRLDFGWQELLGTLRSAVSSQSALAANGLYHLVGTYDNAVMRLYRNGVQIASTVVASSSPKTSLENFRFSRGQTGTFFNGVLDEVAVYNTVLPPERVWTHYIVGKEQSGLASIRRVI
jgi:hypothetical protein